MHFLLVFNPHAGHGRAHKHLEPIQAAMRSLGWQVDLALTNAPGHATRMVADQALGKYDGVIAAGGDGSIYEVINGYYQNPDPNPRPPLGILPLGTGNAFVRDMDLKQEDWQRALEIIDAGRTRGVDVGRFETGEGVHYFMNILGLGFVADVTETARRLKMFGNTAYTLGVLYRTIFLRPYHAKLKLDGSEIERENLFIEISNSRYTSNFLMAPNARVDDGLLDVTLLSRLSRRRLLSSFPLILTGDHLQLEEVETFQVKNLTIETDVPKVLTPDGELMGSTPLKVCCLNQAVSVFWP